MRNLLFSLLSIMCVAVNHAQVSHGGRPLPLAQTRSFSDNLFESMPAFDVEEELRIDALEGNDLRSYRFAYKFMTDFNSSNSGVNFTLADGTVVWRLGIRSEGAKSINLLFSEYELPEGAQLFIYNPAQTQILGSFNHLNNSELGLLPTSPVLGDELIVEYQEPANASFRGKLNIGEVNHAYRSLLAYEPKDNRSEYWCMSSPVCFDSISGLDSISRSVVLMVLDGSRACTGVLVNNTSNDGKPYLLTASHCMNNDFTEVNPDYAAIAGRIVCFFNYNSPTCDTVRKGTEEMSVASAKYIAVNTRTDMTLLELMETPPAYYRPFYAGWSIEENGGLPAYTGIHHPRASTKRVNIIDNSITLKTFMTQYFNTNSHWNVARYTKGCTDSGSSGSPLFDSCNRVIGLLSGGGSVCYYPNDDFYYAVFKAWNASGNPKEQLKYWLDPTNSNVKTVDGLDPYAYNPCYRLSNIFKSKLNDSIETTLIPNSGRMFGVNSLQINEYAEEYYAIKKAKVEGVYIVTPSITESVSSLNVEVAVYSSAGGKPAQLLHQEIFSPTYTELTSDKTKFVEAPKSLNREQETFVRFSKQVEVSETFFVSYKIISPQNSSFAVYNLRQRQAVQNTAWLNYRNSWIPATQHPILAFNTSLFLDPVVRYAEGSSNETIKTESLAGIFKDAGRNYLSVVIYENNKSSAQIDVYSSNGQRLLSQSMSGNTGRIPLETFQSGIYIVNIRWDNHSHTQKIVL